MGLEFHVMEDYYVGKLNFGIYRGFFDMKFNILIMKNKTKALKYIFKTFIFLGISLAIINFLNIRSLRHDEAMLALNIVNKPISELLKPLDYNQVAPIGFLLIEKFFASLFGYTDWSLRLYPMLSFFISIYLIYHVSYIVIKKQTFALFSTAFYSLSYYIIFFSSDVKQYMSDVMFCLIILLSTLILDGKNNIKQLWAYALIGVISVWFSNISVILLFIAGLCFIYKTYKGNRNYLGVFIVLSFWLVSFIVYYLLFIYEHPTKDFMVKFWSNAGAFLPQNIFSKEFYIALYLNIVRFFSLVGAGKFSIGLVPVFCIGLLFLIKKKRTFLFLSISPIVLHLFLSYTKMYPFHLRLILYLFPIFVIIILSGIFYFSIFFKQKKQGVYYCLFIIPLILNLILLSARGLPLEKEEIKKSLTFLNAEISKGDNLYIYHGASHAFSFYKNRYSEISKTDEKNILTGNKHGNNWLNYTNEIKQIKGTFWIIFSHVWVRQDGLSEENYIIDFLEKGNFQIIKNRKYKRSSVYKVIPCYNTYAQQGI